MWNLLGWIEEHQGLAAWVQAFGSIGAIWGAFEVGRRQSRAQITDAETQRRRQGQGLAYLLGDVLHSFKAELERNPDPIFGAMIEPPAVILQHAESLWLLGEAGDYLLHMLGAITVHNAEVEATKDAMTNFAMTSEEINEARSISLDRMQLIGADCSDAIEAIQKLLYPK